MIHKTPTPINSAIANERVFMRSFDFNVVRKAKISSRIQDFEASKAYFLDYNFSHRQEKG